MAYLQVLLDVSGQEQSLGIDLDEDGSFTEDDLFLISSWVENTARNLLTADGVYVASDAE